MSQKFKVPSFDTVDKEIVIETPDSCVLGIAIDYDDVDHPQVEKDVRKLVRILNEHWK